MRFSRLVIPALLATAACTRTPTDAVHPDPLPTDPGAAAASFDGGLGLGSGHLVSPQGTTTTATASGETVAATTDSTTISGRGGLGLGSGH